DGNYLRRSRNRVGKQEHAERRSEKLGDADARNGRAGAAAQRRAIKILLPGRPSGEGIQVRSRRRYLGGLALRPQPDLRRRDLAEPALIETTASHRLTPWLLFRLARP